MSISRTDVPASDQWNVESMFSNLEAWEKEFKEFTKGPAWAPLAEKKGTLGKSAAQLAEIFELVFDLSRKVELLYTYAHLRHDEDITSDEAKAAYNRILAAYHEFAQAGSWLEPEILSLEDATLEAYLESAALKPYRVHLEKIIRRKAHTLPADQEALLAMSGKALQTSSKAFSALNDADLKFGSITTADGEEKEITHGSYALFIRDQDRNTRRSAFQQLHNNYAAYQNTLCELLGGSMQTHLFNARARKFDTCLEAALFDKNVEPAVYHSLIEAVHQNIDSLHQYMGLRKRLMGVDELHLYDVYVPMTQSVDIKLSYDEAAALVVESVAPLGPEYQEQLRRGLEDERWVDRYENKNKRSGAYSSGCYDSFPFILMNYKGVLRDVFTLAHEAGHSMHSHLSHANQPYHYADYPIFVAEVASTFNEELLHKLLLERFSSREERIFLINERIEDIRATLFRQTMFAEFELRLHQMAERNEPITPSSLNTQFKELNKTYFGPALTVDDEIAVEWSRIPHFYYNFYVYQYATGVSAALSLCDRVSNGGDAEREAYLNFLRGGCSQYPIDLLREAGVDMCTPAPVSGAIEHFRKLTNELETLMADDAVGAMG